MENNRKAHIFARVREVLKVGMVESLDSRDSPLRLINEDLFKQIARQGGNLRVLL